MAVIVLHERKSGERKGGIEREREMKRDDTRSH